MDEEAWKVAYQKYLEVWPCHWDPDRNVPVKFETFKGMYSFAITCREDYEADLLKGILHPVLHYMVTTLDEFLGIRHTKKEFADAFKNGFAFDPEREHPENL